MRIHKDGETITVSFPKDAASGLINNQLDSLSLKFDGVLENVSQDTVYNTCAHDAVDSVLAGVNACVFCYGQTGAGKTFSMSGDVQNYAHRGIVPRALHHIFKEVDLRTDKVYRVEVSYMEIYNEGLYDLLADNPAAADNLAILDDASNTVVRGLTRVEVRSEEEALAQFFTGEQGRSTAVHVLNNSSSRSHALFSVYVETRASAEASERALLSKLHLVDLAGSERTKKTNPSGEQLREASCFNKSLTFLEQVVNALARKDNHVPFRQSKLTAALRDALGGNCRTVMLANLWPEAAHMDECVSTLRFASRVRCLETSAVVNESADPVLALRKAERQVKELRQELAMRDMLSGRGRVGYEDLSEGEQLELQQLVLRYLNGSAQLDELPMDSLKRIKETYKAFKAVAGSWAAASAHGSAHGGAADAAAGQGDVAEFDGAGVGDVDTSSSGFCIGTAPMQARPPASPSAAAGRADSSASNAAAGAAGKPGLSPRMAPPSRMSMSSPSPRTQLQTATQQQQQQLTRPGSPLLQQGQKGQLAAAAGGAAELLFDRNALFSKYKHSVADGKRQAEQVKQQQQQMAELKQQIKDIGLQVNSSKEEIDSLSMQLEARKAVTPAGNRSSSSSGGADAGVLDNDQYVLMQQVKAAKARYRTAFDSLRELRGSLDPAVDSLAAAKEALLAGFDAWLAAQQGQQLGATQQIAAWRGDDEMDPGEAFERMELARKAAQAGDPSSTAFFAAASKTGRAAVRSPGSTMRS